MAKLVWKSSSGFKIRLLDVSSLHHGSEYTTTPTSYVVSYSSGYRDEFTGNGFTYDASGAPAGGVVTGYTGYLRGTQIGSIEGLNISVPSLVQAASTTSIEDDFRVFRSALSGNDEIIGGRGADVLEGFSGKDKITGGFSGDLLSGGAGADTFIFKSTRDSRPTWSGSDLIYDFSLKQKDKVDLSAIDANTRKSGNQAFSFIGKSEFHKKAGELRFEKESGFTLVRAT